MANQEEVRDVYGYFEQKGNALCYRYEAERVRIEPWGADSLRVRAWKTAEMDQADWALDQTREGNHTGNRSSRRRSNDP